MLNFSNQKQYKVAGTILFFVSVLSFVLIFIRIHFNVEMSDEIFWISEAKLIAHGSIPIFDNWSQTPLTALLYAWLIPLYENTLNNAIGIVLFFRYCFLFFKVTTLIVAFLVVKQVSSDTDKCLFAIFLLLLFIFFPFNFYVFTYYSLSNQMLLLASSFLYASLFIKKRQLAVFYAIFSAFFTVLAIMGHSMQLLTACMFAIIFFFCSDRKFRFHCIFAYVFSGCIFASILFLYLIFMCKSISGLWNGIKHISTLPYFQLKNENFSSALENILSVLKNFFIIILITLIFTYVYSLISKKYKSCNKYQKRIFIRSYASIMLVLTYSVYVLFEFIHIINTGITTYNISEIIATLLLISPACLLINRKRNLFYLYIIFWFPSTLSVLLMGLTAFNGIASRWQYGFTAVAISVIFTAHALSASHKHLKKTFQLLSFSAYILTLLIVFTSYNYLYSYRDVSVSNANYVVSSGIYKGLHTSKEKGRNVEDIEKIIRSSTSADDYVLFMDNVPMGYLMTDADFCTPSSWDMALYTYGINDPHIYLDYFNIKQKIPTKIIYIDIGRDDILSIHADKYKFNKFVYENYSLTYENTSGYPIYIYTSKDAYKYSTSVEEHGQS